MSQEKSKNGAEKAFKEIMTAFSNVGRNKSRVSISSVKLKQDVYE